jgi:hypothetical protein
MSRGPLGWDRLCMTTTLPATTAELDHRVNDGIEVRLLWCPDDGRVLVAVSDARTREDFTIEVADPSRARDVFHHPYAYAGASPAPRALTEAAP